MKIGPDRAGAARHAGATPRPRADGSEGAVGAKNRNSTSAAAEPTDGPELAIYRRNSAMGATNGRISTVFVTAGA
jgi:hypothetical protein